MVQKKLIYFNAKEVIFISFLEKVSMTGALFYSKLPLKKCILVIIIDRVLIN